MPYLNKVDFARQVKSYSGDTATLSGNTYHMGGFTGGTHAQFFGTVQGSEAVLPNEFITLSQLLASGGTFNGIENQFSSAQTTSNFWIDGTGKTNYSIANYSQVLNAPSGATDVMRLDDVFGKYVTISSADTITGIKTFTQNVYATGGTGFYMDNGFIKNGIVRLYIGASSTGRNGIAFTDMNGTSIASFNGGDPSADNPNIIFNREIRLDYTVSNIFGESSVLLRDDSFGAGSLVKMPLSAFTLNSGSTVYVPYTGATKAVDIGSNSLTVSGTSMFNGVTVFNTTGSTTSELLSNSFKINGVSAVTTYLGSGVTATNSSGFSLNIGYQTPTGASQTILYPWNVSGTLALTSDFTNVAYKNSANTFTALQTFNTNIILPFGVAASFLNPGGASSVGLVLENAGGGNHVVKIPGGKDGVLALLNDIYYSYSLITDASYSPLGANAFLELSTITANRSIILPIASGFTGQRMLIWNTNTDPTYTWSFSGGTVKDKTNSTVTTMTDLETYTLISTGVVWLIT